jgi:hypothetical protein
MTGGMCMDGTRSASWFGMTEPALPRLYAHGRALDSIKPWRVVAVDFTHEMSHDGFVHHELPGGITLSTQTGGTCDRCGMAIQNMITLGSPLGTCVVGEDCAAFLEMPPAARAELARAMKEHRRDLAQARAKKAKAARKAARPAPLPLGEADRAALDRLAEGPAGFGQRFATERVQAGRALTAEQQGLLGRLLAGLDAPPSRSRHLGRVGERIETEAAVTFVRAFGHRTLVVLADDAGNVLGVWCDGTTLEKNDRVTVRGRVRAHGARQGTCQTEIDRVTLAKIVLVA